MAAVTLRAEGIVGGYSDLDILHGVTVEVDHGEVVCIIGPNGAGKSTLARAIFGLIFVRGGRVLLDGADITHLATNRVVEAGLAYVPQVSNVFPNLTVSENLELGGYLRPDAIPEAKKRVESLFPLLAERRAQKVARLSGGQRQMVAIARALMLAPKAILLDEPSAGLAPMLQDAVFEQVRKIADAGTAVLLVEQNAKRALAMSTRGYVLDQGRNKYEGSGRELLADPNIGRLYLGGD